jgi:hypothetical protein
MVHEGLAAARVLAPLERSELRELADVRSRDERLLARARDHDAAQRRVALRRGNRGAELLENLGVQGIQLFGSVDRDDADSLLGILDADEAHDPYS